MTKKNLNQNQNEVSRLEFRERIENILIFPNINKLCMSNNMTMINYPPASRFEENIPEKH